jgi:glycosyltransferase involved in cell wall biosynthesis
MSQLVSIVIPTFNREALLRDAIQSVFAQTYAHWELLIVDDGSTDATRAYLETITDERVRSILLDHSGNRSLVRNAGIRAARGSYIGFLDSDDIWDPQKLALQIEDLAAHPECRWCYTGTVLVDEAGQEIHWVRDRRWPPHRGWILEPLVEGRAFAVTSTLLVERALLEAIGGFDPTLPPSEDIELGNRLAEASPASVVSMPLVTWRRHPGNRATASLEMLGYRVRILEGLLARTSSSRVRHLCRLQRIRVSLEFVSNFRRAGRYSEAWRALWRSFPYACWRPPWWIALLKTLLRPAIPRGLLSLWYNREA